MATYCPHCEKPIRTGQQVRGQFIAEFKNMPGGVSHQIQIIEEEWLEHVNCRTAEV